MNSSTHYFDWLNWTLPPNVVVGQLYICAPLALAVVAAVVAVALLYVADQFNLARWVWHPPLFTLSFYCLIYTLLGLWLLPR
ncbi:MAG: DUF1656 domain-containing protein [Opitutales bacterium]